MTSTSERIAPPHLPYEKHFATIRNTRMAYVDAGQGPPILFLHGNPTSSYLWRNVLPHLESSGRCIAPDLVGMGDSDKLPDSGPDRYRIPEHRDYLDALLETLGVRDRVTLVLHDWGSALGFDWARRHADAVRGIAYMESIVRPYTSEEMAGHGDFIRQLRGPEGERMILEENLFVEQFLPLLIQRELAPEEMAEYRRPFAEPGEGRRPTLTMPGSIPIDGEPPETFEMVSAYSEWLQSTPIPKLFLNAEPGAAITGEIAEFCRTFPNQTEVAIRGLHFVQEDDPDTIGTAIRDWLAQLP